MKNGPLKTSFFYASFACLFASRLDVGRSMADWSHRAMAHWPGHDDVVAYDYDRRWPGPYYREERPPHNPYHPRRPLQTAITLLHLDEGDVCRRGHGLYPDYVCTEADDCREPLAESVRNDNYLDICTYSGTQVVVCCPLNDGGGGTSSAKVPAVFNSKVDRPSWISRPSTATTTTTTTPTASSTPARTPVDIRGGDSNVAAEKCRQYSNLQFPKENFWFIAVVGGREALSQEFPHMAVLGYGNTTELEEDWKCGGSLISEKWILTAAHCRTDKSGSLCRWARLGELSIGSNLDSSKPKDYKIVDYVLHPDYKPSERYNDIGLFRLGEDVEFSSYMRPICLNTDSSLNPKVQIATGWGRTSTAESSSDILLKVALNIFPVSRCNDTYFTSESTELRFGISDDSMICAGSYKDDEDTCSGDSGGPLQVPNEEFPGTYTQFGITSFGPAFCGVKETPGVYTKVSKYVPWIEQIVWPSS